MTDLSITTKCLHAFSCILHTGESSLFICCSGLASARHS